MGYWAGETLADLLDEPESVDRPASRPLLMPCPLVSRSSVAPA
jgi:LacI family transcriptional regulator